MSDLSYRDNPPTYEDISEMEFREERERRQLMALSDEDLQSKLESAIKGENFSAKSKYENEQNRRAYELERQRVHNLSDKDLEKELNTIKEEGRYDKEHKILMSTELKRGSHVVLESLKRAYEAKKEKFNAMSIDELKVYIESQKSSNAASEPGQIDMFAEPIIDIEKPKGISPYEDDIAQSILDSKIFWEKENARRREIANMPVSEVVERAREKKYDSKSISVGQRLRREISGGENQFEAIILDSFSKPERMLEVINDELTNLDINHGYLVVCMDKFSGDKADGGLYFVSKNEMKKKGYEPEEIKMTPFESSEWINQVAASYIPLSFVMSKEQMDDIELGEDSIAEAAEMLSFTIQVEKSEPIPVVTFDDEGIETKARYGMVLNNVIDVVDGLEMPFAMLDGAEYRTYDEGCQELDDAVDQAYEGLTSRIEKSLELRAERKKNTEPLSRRSTYFDYSA